MENASKALIMAGSVLISLLVIGALLLMFNNLSSYQESDLQNTREKQVIEFNNQFATYNRENIRGNELYSLINKVIDYNTRKTIEGNAGGIEIGYKPMTIKFSLKSDNGKTHHDFAINEPKLFSKDDYTIAKTAGIFENDILNTIQEIEDEFGNEVLSKLSTAITKVFIDNSETEQRKKQAVESFNNIVNSRDKINNFNEINEDSEIRKDIYTYYEYVQFKRAKFDCIKCEYDKDTGRIILMEFKFNGNIQ